jgi:hypothetical protein
MKQRGVSQQPHKKPKCEKRRNEKNGMMLIHSNSKESVDIRGTIEAKSNA